MAVETPRRAEGGDDGSVRVHVADPARSGGDRPAPLRGNARPAAGGARAAWRRLGVKTERVWHQQTPEGTFAVVYLEADDLGRVFTGLATSDDPFVTWWREQILAVHGVDLSQPLPDRLMRRSTTGATPDDQGREGWVRGRSERPARAVTSAHWRVDGRPGVDAAGGQPSPDVLRRAAPRARSRSPRAPGARPDRE